MTRKTIASRKLHKERFGWTFTEKTIAVPQPKSLLSFFVGWALPTTPSGAVIKSSINSGLTLCSLQYSKKTRANTQLVLATPNIPPENNSTTLLFR